MLHTLSSVINGNASSSVKLISGKDVISIPSPSLHILHNLHSELTNLCHRALSFTPGDLSPTNLRASLISSLKALCMPKVHTFYLHAPDRSVPVEDTLRAINDLYNEGYLYAFLFLYRSNHLTIIQRRIWLEQLQLLGGL